MADDVNNAAEHRRSSSRCSPRETRRTDPGSVSGRTTFTRAYFAAALAQAGKVDAAQAEVAAYRKLADDIAALAIESEPVFDILNAGLVTDLRVQKNPAAVELWFEGLRKTGLPV